MTMENERTDSAAPAARVTGSLPGGPRSDLRRQAEEKAAVLATQGETSLSPDETQRLVHELRVHQIELELQNEELRRTQLGLETSHARYLDLYDLAPVGYVTLGAQDAILQTNLTAAALFGVPRGQLLQQPLTRFIVSEDQDDYYRYRRQLLDTDQPQVCELRMVRHDGTGFWARLQATMGQDGDCQTPVSRVTLSDITVGKRAEEELARARDAAQTSSRRKAEFLANMSHEIRTPMTAILGFSDLLATAELTRSEQGEFLQLIRSNGDALLRLINDILDLSRIEADHLHIQQQDCQLQPLLDDVLAAVKMLAAEKGIGLQLVCRLPLPDTIRTDPARLRQILVNLVSNAVKFTQQGEVHLQVRTLAEGTRLQFVVKDTGIGIPADRLQELFQPFVQVDRSDTRRFGGSGLGLAISQRLAQALGGQIEVASELDQGSAFSLTIDSGLAAGVCLSPPPAAEREAGPAVARVREFSGRVLLAEDSTDCQMVVRFLLKKRKLDVDLAADGQVACELAEQSRSEGRPYDLILMDMQMPRLNGFEATRWLRQQGWRGPIVALTAYAMAGDRERCLQAGCDDYLAKPISMNEFQAILQRHLSQQA